jgi:hypothetical protein
MIGIQVLDRPASHSFYAVAGRLLFVESFDRHLAASIERLFAGWQLTPVSFPEQNPDVNIVFFCGQHLPDIPSDLGLTQCDVANGGRFYAAAGCCYLRFENSLLRCQPLAGSRDRVDVAIWLKKPPAPPDAELARVTSFAVCAALRRFGLFELHSAGVVLPQSNDGVLIVGPSGSGKSTLTLQLASAGWGYLSDDELLLSAAGEEVEARGFRSFFALAPPSAATAVGPNGMKTCFEPAGVFTAPAVACVAPRFVLFTSISRARQTRVSELTQSETMTRLIRACPWAAYDTAVAGPNLALLSRLARKAKGFDLIAGTDLLEPGEASRIIRAACHA